MGLFRRLFGAKRACQSSSSEDKRRSFSRSSNNTTPSQPNKRDVSSTSSDGNLDANKHAIAVAVATAAVAEAALAAAHAAAEVVRLTNTGGTITAHVSQQRWLQELSAVKIQSAFRGYLARRALKALKALVKLQALVRGHIVRKQTADMLKRMQTLVKVQARARASRAHMTESLRSHSKSSIAHSTRCGSNSNFGDIGDLDKARLGSNWLGRWMEESVWNNHRANQLKSGHIDDKKCDKILEVDTWKPHFKSQQYSRTFQTTQHSDYNNPSCKPIDSPSKLLAKTMNLIPSVSSGEVLPLSSLRLPVGKGEAALSTADNSPQVASASYRPGSSGRRGPFTPIRECAWGYFSGYSGYPNYMANTELSRAKVRSQSAPKQRLEFERYGSTRWSAQEFGDGSIISEQDFAQHADFWNRAFPASDRLNKLGSTNLR